MLGGKRSRSAPLQQFGMAKLCAWGADPKPGAPQWFTFEEADLVAALPIAGTWLTRFLIGVPNGPQSVADFCAAGVEDDFPSELDYAAIALPSPLSFATGAYGRFGNQVKAAKFRELCVCRPAPAGEGGASAAVWYEVCHVDINQPGAQTYHCLWDAADYAPGLYRFVEHWDRGGVTWAHMDIRLQNVITQDWPSGPIEQPFHRYRDATARFDEFRLYVDDQANRGDFAGYIAVERFGVPPGDLVPPAPPVESAPSGYPARPFGPGCADFQDVCNMIAEAVRELTALATLQRNTTVQTQRTGLIPGPTHQVSGIGSLAVRGTLGVSLSLSGVPAALGRRAVNPPTYVDLGWLTPRTDFGSLESVPVQHDVQVFLWPPTVTNIAWDLLAGVNGTMTELLPA
jgi:hypothetical protein